jgi:hypothetical protein
MGVTLDPPGRFGGYVRKGLPLERVGLASGEQSGYVLGKRSTARSPMLGIIIGAGILGIIIAAFGHRGAVESV